MNVHTTSLVIVRTPKEQTGSALRREVARAVKPVWQDVPWDGMVIGGRAAGYFEGDFKPATDLAECDLNPILSVVCDGKFSTRPFNAAAKRWMRDDITAMVTLITENCAAGREPFDGVKLLKDIVYPLGRKSLPTLHSLRKPGHLAVVVDCHQ